MAKHAENSTVGDESEALQEPETVGFTPTFNATIRTIIYVSTLLMSVLGLAFITFGHPDIGGFISTACGMIAGGFGVAYNPLRMNSQ
ncbi:MAG: hypothetical protein SO360_01740 [Bifidobacterium tsurumiense]|uniref:hypothetical protein n=1 Tax=Bifidobacterium tsurumiense TaxID=356829 RepID=UPI002A800B76|nr:hypothetical protein [Bifidobacterium tsurumiense]MDY4677574.1 hypothetical protein [Bifidobacterium tsurumiense]